MKNMTESLKHLMEAYFLGFKETIQQGRNPKRYNTNSGNGYWWNWYTQKVLIEFIPSFFRKYFARPSKCLGPVSSYVLLVWRGTRFYFHT